MSDNEELKFNNLEEIICKHLVNSILYDIPQEIVVKDAVEEIVRKYNLKLK